MNKWFDLEHPIRLSTTNPLSIWVNIWLFAIDAYEKTMNVIHLKSECLVVQDKYTKLNIHFRMRDFEVISNVECGRATMTLFTLKNQ